MKIDRSTWVTAYKFHKEALEKLGQMEQEPFWEWMAARMIEISNANGNGALIMALLLAVVLMLPLPEDLSAWAA